MRIKEREESNFFFYIKRILNLIYGVVHKRKTKIVFGLLVTIVILIIGMFLGLLISGFFGTFDTPSRNALSIAHALGIDTLREFKSNIEWILEENIKIPFNYIKGLFSNPERIYIDIGFENFQKLRYYREKALEEGVNLMANEEDVPATITYNNKKVNVDLRLKGDALEHLETKKWSFRIQAKGGETLFGMTTFAIQHPKTREYLYEFLYHSALKREDILSIRYEFIEVYINGERKGIYALEESFDKQVIEHNNKIEGPIIRFAEEVLLYDALNEADYLNKKINLDITPYFPKSSIDAFKTNKILGDSVAFERFNKAKNLLELFRRGELKTHEVFNTEELAKYFAINSLMGGNHASTWPDLRFYYNPHTSRLEPIGYDAELRGEVGKGTIENYIPSCIKIEGYDTTNCSVQLDKHHELFFSDGIFFQKYIEELERVSEKSYLDSFFTGLNDGIKRNMDIIHKDYPHYHLNKDVFYENQNYIKLALDPVKSINAYFEKSLSSKDTIVLSTGNVDRLPIEILNCVYNDSIIFPIKTKVLLQPKISNEPVYYRKVEFKIPNNFQWEDNFVSNLKINYKILGVRKIKNESIISWGYVDENFIEEDFIRKKPNIENWEFLEINENIKSISIKKGIWTLNESLIIPEGYTVFCGGGTKIDLINNSTILSYSNLRFSGSEKEPIMIMSSDGTGQGLTVQNCEKESYFGHVIFDKLSNPSQNNWELTGTVTFYEAPVKIDNVLFLDIKSEDALNIVRTNFEIKNSVFKNSLSDCFDSDFAVGTAKDSSFINCGGDGVDFSGALINVSDVNVSNAGDKGISIGENSSVIIENAEVDKSYIGVASKDQSELSINNTKISNCDYGFAVYQKKPEFGPSSVSAFNTDLELNKEKYIIEKGSFFSIENTIVLGSEEKVYEKLYPETNKTYLP